MKTEYNNVQLKYFSWLANYQLVFGVIGVILLLINLGIATEIKNGMLFFLFKAILYAIPIYGGVQYHLGEYKSSMLYLKVGLILQIIGIYYHGFIYEFAVGLAAIADYMPDFNVISGRINICKTNIYLGEGEGVIISLNVIALILLMLLFKIESKFSNNINNER